MNHDKMTPSEYWAVGLHKSSSGKIREFKELPTPYLQNIINKYGEQYDTSPLKKELESRPQDDNQSEG